MQNTELNRRVLAMYSAMLDIFELEKKDWDQFRKELSDEQISQFYSVINKIWPPDTDVFSLLPKPSKQLRAFYIGETSHDLLTKSINRAALYTDQILVDMPFFLPHTIRQEYNPVVNPSQYKQDTLELIFLLFKLVPWVQHDIVNIIPSPMDFDPGLRHEIWDLAEKRFAASGLKADDLFTEEEIKRRGMEAMRKFTFRLPDKQLRQWLANTPSEIFGNISIDEMVEYIKSERRSDPLLVDQEVDLDGELRILRNGSNLEGGLMISELTGSYLYASSMNEWRQLAAIANDDDEGSAENNWQQLSLAFQELDFKFLNNVDPAFALEMRGNGRLENFRTYLREVWQNIETSDHISSAKVRKLSDELKKEYNAAEAEWSQIDKRLTKWLTGPRGVGAILSAGMDWKIPALGFSIDAVGQLLSARTDRKNFRNNVPLGVFVDLARKKKR